MSFRLDAVGGHLVGFVFGGGSASCRRRHLLRRWLIGPCPLRDQPGEMAAIAAGAHGVIVEVHTHPDKALCDGPQALLPIEFNRLMQQIRGIATAGG